MVDVDHHVQIFLHGPVDNFLVPGQPIRIDGAFPIRLRIAGGERQRHPDAAEALGFDSFDKLTSDDRVSPAGFIRDGALIGVESIEAVAQVPAVAHGLHILLRDRWLTAGSQGRYSHGKRQGQSQDHRKYPPFHHCKLLF